MDKFSIFAPEKCNQSSNAGIKDWKEDDRPREKSLLNGIGTLTDAELLAILIGTGSQTQNAVELARSILSAAGNKLSNLSRMGYKDLCNIKGVGKAKAVTIMSAFEIGRRRRIEDVPVRAQFSKSTQLAEAFVPMLADLPHEEFWILLLNNANHCLAKLRISQGGVHQTVADPKIIFKEALQHLATGIVLCHNHPSGSKTPSKHDMELTHQIIEGAHALSIRVLDHIIVAGNDYLSFAEEGILF
ncbi:MAG: DNA repair protein RadC [Paludibacteraceae bacterium]|nr:DNA repair protein RadC [Paludibacteraceae bacterium]MBQ1752650.1 DNA repair protein RadC [Paludibacteraceae bacterium]MBQ2065073.1 DNA repair protein RadC [Paludibacteraceae bacterium]